ncbi:MAG: hypothetical protein AAB276_04880, partial [Pseudomonadota bacterium]
AALVGAGAIPVIFTAAAGGAAVGLVRVGMNLLRQQQPAHPNSSRFPILGFKRNDPAPDTFFSRKTLMTTASSAAISAATCGFLDLDIIKQLSGINLAQSITKGMSALFNQVSAPVAAMVQTNDNLLIKSAPLFSSSNAVLQNVPTAPTNVINDAPPSVLQALEAKPSVLKVPALDVPKSMPVPIIETPETSETPEISPAAELPEQPAPVEESIVPADVAPVEADAVVAETANVVEAAEVVAEAVTVEAAEAVASVDVVPPQLPDMEQEFKLAEAAAKAQYVEDELRERILSNTGVAAPADMSAEDMAAQIAPNNPQDLLQDIMFAAPKLDASKMTSACVSHIPANQAELVANNNVVSTTCVSVKEDMDAGDFITVRDAAVDNPTPKKGLRLLFSNATAKVADFMGLVSREAVPSMMPKFEDVPLTLADATPTQP